MFKLIKEDNSPTDLDAILNEEWKDILDSNMSGHAISISEWNEKVQAGTLTPENIRMAVEEIITSLACGATLRATIWKGDAEKIKDEMSRLRAYDMNGWSTDENAFRSYGLPNVVFKHTDVDFGYELLQMGPYILLASGFST